MLANLLPRSRKCYRAAFALPAIFAISLLLSTILTARAAAPKQVLNPAMPEILEKVAQQLPDAWHPKQMRNGDVQLHNPVQHLNTRIDQHGIHIMAGDGFAFNMQLTRFGFNGALKKPQPGGVQVNGVGGCDPRPRSERMVYQFAGGHRTGISPHAPLCKTEKGAVWVCRRQLRAPF